MKFDMENRVVVITGGCGLLGIKHAEAVAEFGANPILLDIVEDNYGNKKAKEIIDRFDVKCNYYRCDITDESEVSKVNERIISNFNKVDVLINNAAVDPKVASDNSKNLSRLENFSKDQWDLELAVGLTGAMLCSKIFGSEMAKNNKGVILNISSDLGIIAPDQRPRITY